MIRRARGILTFLAAAVVFALLPALGAAAAEPLDDGTYDVVVEEATFTVDVVDGTPVVADDGASFSFAFDEATGRVLDQFTVTVDGRTYEVDVDDDGQATTELVEEPSEEEPVADPNLSETSTEDVDEDDTTTPTSDDDEDDSDDDSDDAEADDAHGELVSTVAECAPTGRTARDAGLPNHGTFVSAAARGESVDFEVDGETHTADLTSPEGAAAFCELADELVAAAADADGDDGEDGDAAESDEAPGNGKAQGRDKARGPHGGDTDEADADEGVDSDDAEGEDADDSDSDDVTDDDDDEAGEPEQRGRSGSAPGKGRDG